MVNERRLLICVCFATLLSLAACRSRETATPSQTVVHVQQTITPTSVAYPTPQAFEISFETVDRDDVFGSIYGFPNRQPGLLVFTKPEELSDVSGWITSDAMQKLQALDLNFHIAIAIFQGEKAVARFGVIVDRVVRSENIVTIYATFHEPKPDEPKQAVVTHPYHIIKIMKQGPWAANTDFLLNVAGQVVATSTKYIP